MGICVLHIISNLVACLVLISHLISGNSNVSEPSCIISIKVPRNTFVRATVKKELNISCTVTKVKCQGIPKITWCKLFGNDCKALNQSNYTETMWKDITQHDGISILTFLNISMEDAGLYRCKSPNSISHTINVTVTDAGFSNHTSNTSKGEEIPDIKDDLQSLLLYVYICTGVVGLVIIVITVSIVIIRCQGKKSKRHEKTTKIQYTEEQRSDPITPSHPRHNTHPTSAQPTSAVSFANDTPPVRAGSHRNLPSAGRVPANTTELKGSRNNDRTAEDEDNLLVYASLNHQAVSRGPRRTVQQETEPSEYAAIRFR